MISFKTFVTSFLEEKKKRFYTANFSFLVSVVPILWMVVFFVVPLLIVLRISLSESTFGIPPYMEMVSLVKKHAIQINLNFNNYFALLKDSYYTTAFINSIGISIVSTFFCLVVGYMMAYGISTLKRDSTKSFFILLISMSFWTPFLIRIYSCINLMNTHGVINNFLMKLHIISSPIQFLGNYYAISAGIVFCYLPFMIFPIYSVLERIDKSYVEAAYDLCCPPFKTFWTVTVPLTKYGIITGCILVFAITIGEFVIPELLGGPGALTIGRFLWIEFFDNIDWPIACSLSVVLTVFIIFPIFFLQTRFFKEDKNA